MITIDFLPQTAFTFMLIFSRLAAMIMLMPALGETSIPAQVRLVMAFLLSLVMMPLVASTYGAIPVTVPGLAFIVFTEIAVGLFIGGVARIIMSALHVAGNIIALQMSLAFAQNVDPTQGQQGVLISNFLSLLAVTLIFATSLDHLLIAAMRDSYEIFVPGQAIPVGDFSQMAVKLVSDAFRIGLQLAAPFLVFGLVFYVGIGLLSRLMPQIQIFFIAMPANITLGLVLLLFLLGAMMTWFLQAFEQSISMFAG
ncbi:flagellar biosynthetic protein FliR [Parvibaculum sp.]|jgi:flagellar biosynthetic protein FliR|uniref:flagellar biosynthetic protein FliR n=1 Tax=Parvibaculum sp. TaxID=2024848 RepID=UPI000C410A32|nr:flagellar biosynthetic protein FliR [Parvibaculum sp.]HAC57242.1 flagellar type III secretion system protein FliR [Rhodobiaceae bacterium]MAU60047.1 flagellar biosynthetic protein FliR [Parvibaculum sp.]MBO6668988.1 flagellar type III secretion system protein FliR [Parvibaculum sp.]MBO6692087.1 flagellar type III secretion system protein FliR [Parvibaculum sp.]MBO6715462.1 flagellar type III secretion system protein FliR [Parvibaculum sp.]|tara:strand:+ start:6000 stop:6761 length:762 start_codon:yes stop_codon:yes gene_type:complete